jgi:unsaturated rhamnogalacturonyl hydrolase
MKTTGIALLLLFCCRAGAQTVLLDSYYNNETRVGANGGKESWHYKWEETDNGGFSLWAAVFRKNKAQLRTNYARPAKKILQKADIFIIVDPDIPKENPMPDYITAKDIKKISNWVKAGGVLVLMGNDTGNAEFTHLNALAGVFGIHFNEDNRNHAINKQFELGGFVCCGY